MEMGVDLPAMMGRASELDDEAVTGKKDWWLGPLNSGDSFFAY